MSFISCSWPGIKFSFLIRSMAPPQGEEGVEFGAGSAIEHNLIILVYNNPFYIVFVDSGK